MKSGIRLFWCAFVLLFLFLPISTFGFQPKTEKTDLSQKEFFLPELYIGNKAVSRNEISSQLKNNSAWDSFLAEYGSETVVWFDPRSGHPMSIVSPIPLFPGKGVGNRLTIETISLQYGKPVKELTPEIVGELFRNFIIKNQGAIGIDLNQLGPISAAKVNERLWHISIPQVVNGIPVRWGRYLGTINSGNIVVQGAATWGNVNIDTKPQITSAQAVKRGFEYAGGQLSNDRLWKEPQLEIIPYAPKEFAMGEHGYTGPPGSGYKHRLVWVYGFQRAPENPHWEVMVDAQNGEVISFEDKNQYIEKQIKGGIYPLTNTEICNINIQCGELQPDSPMPFTNTGLPAPNNFTNSGGVYDYTSGTVTTTLSGPYVVLSDTCGAINVSSPTGDLNLGGVNGDHDCDTPTSGGNTAASRSGMYEVNKIFETARGYLPNNQWLQGNQGGPLPTNMNINQACNAFYTLGDPGTINFYRQLGGCRNTGEIAAVFDHEWGHGMDDHDTIGQLSNSSEGYADIASMYRLWASCVGHGFFWTLNQGCGMTADGTGFNQDEAQTGSSICDLDCSGVRDADYLKIQGGNPLGASFVCSSCLSGGGGPCGRQVHCSATPTREAAWNLVARELQNPPNTDVDANTAFIIGDKVFYQGSGNIGTWHNCSCPTTSDGCNSDGGYLQWLAADDDDGAINNGTPHMVDIHAAFNTNGIACPNPAPTQSGCSGGPITPPVLAAAPSNNSAILTWNSVANAQRYNVYRTEGFAGCDFGKSLIGTVNSPTTTFTDTEVANDRPYWYVVMAEGSNDACFTPASNCVNATPAPCAGSVILNGNVFSCTDTIQITVVDSDLVGDGTITVAVTSTTETTPEITTLNENPSNSGTFTGSIDTTRSAPASDGDISVVHGDTITVAYSDESFCGDPQVVTATATTDCLAVLTHDASAFTDDCSEGGAGDGDGILDPGETALLQVTAQNTSITDATGVSATLTTSTPGVTITDNTATFPDIPAGGSATSNAPHFAFTVNSNIGCATFIDFTINYTTNEGNSSDDFTVLVGLTTVFTNTYTSTDVPKTIADLSTTTSMNNVTGSGPINDVNLQMTLLHTADEHLDISLVGPNTTEVLLSSDNGGQGNDYTGTTFDDEASTSITAGSPPFTGSFRPEGSLSDFDDSDKAGTWTLKIIDDQSGQTGNLFSWKLTIKTDGAVCHVCGEIPPECPTITLSPSTLSDGVVGTPYNATIIASGGTAPYTFAVTSGALPDGLTLDSNTGSISGTPTVANTFNFTITATDADDCTGSQAYTVTITDVPPPTCTFCDEFEDSVLAADWTYIKNNTPWSEASDALIATSTKKTSAIATPVFAAGCLNCYVETILRTAGGVGNRLSLFHHYIDKFNNVELLAKEEQDAWVLKHRIGGAVVVKQKVPMQIDPNTDYTVRIDYDGINYIVSINGTEVITLAPGGAVTQGTVGFQVKATTGTFQRIEVNP